MGKADATRSHGLVVALLLLVAAATLSACSALGVAPVAGSSDAASEPPAPVVGRVAPDFTLSGLDGESVTLSQLRGRPVVVNFWATWCGPCRAEMPEFQAAQERYRDSHKLEIVFVDFQESADVVRPFVEEIGIKSGVVLDENGEVGRTYRVRGMPSTFFIDRGGVIQAAHMGAMDRSLLERGLGKIFNE